MLYSVPRKDLKQHKLAHESLEAPLGSHVNLRQKSSKGNHIQHGSVRFKRHSPTPSCPRRLLSVPELRYTFPKL